MKDYEGNQTQSSSERNDADAKLDAMLGGIQKSFILDKKNLKESTKQVVKIRNKVKIKGIQTCSFMKKNVVQCVLNIKKASYPMREKLKVYSVRFVKAVKKYSKQITVYAKKVCKPLGIKLKKDSLRIGMYMQTYGKQCFVILKKYAKHVKQLLTVYGKLCIKYIKKYGQQFYQAIIIQGVKTFQSCREKRKELALQKEYVKFFRIYFVSDMEKEEAYLHAMSLKGLHFVKKQGIHYVFQRGESKSYFYHLGYHEKGAYDEEEYVVSFTRAGWESICHEKGEFEGGWHYFRMEASSQPEIFSDYNARIALYTRLLSSWRTLIAMIIIFVLFLTYLLYYLITHPNSVQMYALVVCMFVYFGLFLTLGMYVYMYMKTSKILQHFKYKS